MKEKISKEEQIIIDEILLPKLKDMNEEEKEKILSEYSKYIMIGKEYFLERTGFKESDKEAKNFIKSIEVKVSSLKKSEKNRKCNVNLEVEKNDER